MVASAAPTVVAPEVTTELPGRFAMYLVTEEARANGLRIRYANSESLILFTTLNPFVISSQLTPALPTLGDLLININESPTWPSVDGVCESHPHPLLLVPYTRV